MFSNTVNPQGSRYILAYQNCSNTAITYKISREFTNVPADSKLFFFYQIQSPGGKIQVKVNDTIIWSKSGFKWGEDISIDLPMTITNPRITVEAEFSSTQSVKLSDIRLKP